MIVVEEGTEVTEGTDSHKEKRTNEDKTEGGRSIVGVHRGRPPSAANRTAASFVIFVVKETPFASVSSFLL